LVGDDGRPLLSDFGCAKIVGERGFTTTQPAYTEPYLAPELFETILQWDNQGLEDNDMTLTTKKSDIYAFAMVGLEV
jgi:serine/threonine protein kinase